jgi:tRNA(fMet)-specific endonuclease VapC
VISSVFSGQLTTSVLLFRIVPNLNRSKNNRAMLRFLDTDICVAFLRGTSVRVRDRLLQHSRATVALPAIVVAELLLGLEKSTPPRRHGQRVEDFVESFQIAAFGANAAKHYARIRALLEAKGEPIGANDYLVAAIVAAEQGVLVTGNIREFRKVPGLKLENWLAA